MDRVIGIRTIIIKTIKDILDIVTLAKIDNGTNANSFLKLNRLFRTRIVKSTSVEKNIEKGLNTKISSLMDI